MDNHNQNAEEKDADRVLLKSNRMAAAVYDMWIKTQSKAYILAEMSKKYAVFLSLEQIDALIEKGKMLHARPE